MDFNVIPILLKYLGQKCSTAKSQKTNNTGLTTFHLQVAKMTFMYSTKALNREVGPNTYCAPAVACIFFTPFFTAIYNQERLILETIMYDICFSAFLFLETSRYFSFTASNEVY